MYVYYLNTHLPHAHIWRYYMSGFEQGYIDLPKAERGHVTPIYRHVNVEIQTWQHFSNVSNGHI